MKSGKENQRQKTGVYQMTAREFLKQSLKVKCKLDCKLEQVQELKDLANRITPVFNGTPTVSNKCLSKLESAIVNLQDQSEILGEDVVKYLKIRAEIADTIKAVVDENERLILEYRYLTFRTWKKIAAAMNMSLSKVYQLHVKALDSFEKIFEEKTKM